MAKINIFKQISLLHKLLSLLSLSTPISRVVIFTLVLLFFTFLPYPLINKFPNLSLYQNLGIKTYSWGQTRALSLILHGQFLEAWEMNKLSYLILIVIIILLVKDVKKLLHNR